MADWATRCGATGSRSPSIPVRRGSRTGIWQGVVRDSEGPLRQQVLESIAADRLKLELLYGDHEGGQPTISWYFIDRHEGGEGWSASASRHWILEPDAARFLQR
jgi:hypothetical protein